MTDTPPIHDATRLDAPVERMRAVADTLAIHGLTTQVHDCRAGADVTATLSRPGHRDSEVVIDEDGYTELRYWNESVDPAELSATALRALAAVAPLPPQRM